MKNNRFFIKVKGLICIISVLAILSTMWTFLCSVTTTKTIKVGYMDYNSFIEVSADGKYTGYGVDYLNEISKYTGYKYEYVKAQWSDLLEMLENKEIDLLCTAQKTSEREEIFDFSAYPSGYTQGVLYTNQDSKVSYEDFDAFNNMKVGILDKTAMRDIFLNYEKKNNFSCDLVTYASESEMTIALEKNEIDAICTENLSKHTNLSLLAMYGADAYYFMSYKNSPYINEINDSLQLIKADADFETNLYHRYYDDSSSENTLTFTTAEKEYISKNKTIKMGIVSEREPFTYYDDKTGELCGINIDVLHAIEEKSGLKFEYKALPKEKKIVELMPSDDYDVICGVERDNFVDNDTLISTDAFMESAIVPCGKIGRNIDINDDLIAAIPMSFQALHKVLEENYPNITILDCNNNRECLEAVLNDEADVFIQNTHVMSSLIQEPKYEELSILPVQIMTEHTAMVLPKSTDSILFSIINKSIDNLDEATIDSSLIEHTFANPYKYTFGDIVYKFKVQISIVGGLILLCFILLASVAIIRRKAENKAKKQNVLLADAVSQADRASTAKSKFLSQMSHEIRTPMNAIVGLTTIAKKYEDDPQKVDEYLNKIDASSKVLLNIINDVLDMSAIESNKIKIAKTEFDIKQVINGISTIYYPQCESKGISFNMVTDIENELLIGDALRVNQIILNLVSNAFKFTDKGGKITICVKQTATRDNTAYIRFTVSDTGCGMSEEMQQRLFKPFEQEAATTAQKHGGSGLGLSIAKNLVDVMHGAINVESEKGKGSSFSVDLPFEINNDGNINRSEILSNLSVLVIDDDRDSLEYTSIVLSRIGVKFDICTSGIEALNKMEEADVNGKPYDVCLIDWKMPKMDGIEVTRRIRANEKNKTLIIIISAYDLNEVNDEAIKAGADHFVSKPLFQSTVFNILMDLTRGEKKIDTSVPVNYDFKGHKVLLAEDNEMNAEIAIELLNMVNLEVERVDNGQKAVEAFKNNPINTYDLILMDVQMPIMDGYEATRTIRELDREDAKQIKILAMTANTFKEDVSAAISAGMNGHIAKPIDTNKLYQSIQKALNE